MASFIMGNYRWATRHDINAFFTFILDAIVNLFVLSALLQLFNFPQDIINQRIIPGAIIGIVVGNGLYAWLGYRLAKKTGKHEVTAIPLGLDITTTVGFSMAVLIPLFLGLKNELGDAHLAGEITWIVGMAGTLWIGLVKVASSFFGGFIQRSIPIAALIGTMFGIAIVWLGANAFMGIFEMPHVGLIALVVMTYSLISGHQLPFKMPGSVVAIVAGTAVYYIAGMTGILDGFGYGYTTPDLSATGISLPNFTLMGFEEVVGRAMNYLAIIVPLAILVSASCINVSAATNLVGDDYRARDVIRIDATATIVSALFGGVIQTTPYLSHATYKRMEGRIGYSVGVTVALLFAGIFGLVNVLLAFIPSAVIKPILIVVASDIIRLSFSSIPKEHSPAVGFAIMPAILNFAYVKLSVLYQHAETAMQNMGAQITTVLPQQWLSEYVLLGVMARGYILTSLLWAATVVFIIDKKLVKAALMLGICSLFSYFGVMHSVLPSSSVYLPWQLDASSLSEQSLLIPVGFATGYLIAMFVVITLHVFRGSDESIQPQLETKEQ